MIKKKVKCAAQIFIQLLTQNSTGQERTSSHYTCATGHIPLCKVITLNKSFSGPSVMLKCKCADTCNVILNPLQALLGSNCLCVVTSLQTTSLVPSTKIQKEEKAFLYIQPHYCRCITKQNDDLKS